MSRKTSREAFEAVMSDGTVGEMHRDLYECLFHHGPLSATECLAKVNYKRVAEGKSSYSTQTHTRFSEMRKMGIIHEYDKKRCSVTGKRVTFWDVTSAYPSPIKPGVSRPPKMVIAKALQDFRRLSRLCIEAKIGVGENNAYSDDIIKVLRWLYHIDKQPTSVRELREDDER